MGFIILYINDIKTFIWCSCNIQLYEKVKSPWIGCIVLQIHQRVKILQLFVMSAPDFNLDCVMLKSHGFAQLYLQYCM